MKNRQPSILYSSSGFLCPKLLTFTWRNRVHINLRNMKAEECYVSRDINYTAELSLFMFTRWSLQKQSRVFTRTALCIPWRSHKYKQKSLIYKKPVKWKLAIPWIFLSLKDTQFFLIQTVIRSYNNKNFIIFRQTKKYLVCSKWLHHSKNQSII